MVHRACSGGAAATALPIWFQRFSSQRFPGLPSYRSRLRSSRWLRRRRGARLRWWIPICDIRRLPEGNAPYGPASAAGRKICESACDKTHQLLSRGHELLIRDACGDGGIVFSRCTGKEIPEVSFDPLHKSCPASRFIRLELFCRNALPETGEIQQKLFPFTGVFLGVPFAASIVNGEDVV